MLYPTSFEHNSIRSFSWPQVTENNGGIPTFNSLHKLTGNCELEMASEWKEMKHIAAHHPKTVASSASHLSIMQMSDAFLNGTDSNRRKLLWLRPLQHGKSHQIFKRFPDCAYPTSKQGHPRASLLTLKWINSKIPRTRKAWGSDQATLPLNSRPKLLSYESQVLHSQWGAIKEINYVNALLIKVKFFQILQKF